MIAHGEEKPVESLKDIRIDAYTSEQARKLFLDRYKMLLEYLQQGYAVEARFDKALWDEREKARKAKENLREEQSRGAWWQD